MYSITEVYFIHLIDRLLFQTIAICSLFQKILFFLVPLQFYFYVVSVILTLSLCSVAFPGYPSYTCSRTAMAQICLDSSKFVVETNNSSQIWVDHNVQSGGKWGQLKDVFSIFCEIMVC